MAIEGLAARIVRRRKELGYSQVELARRLGMTQANVCNYERGAREPGLDRLTVMANVMRCSTDWLLGIAEASPEPEGVPAWATDMAGDLARIREMKDREAVRTMVWALARRMP
ncbi:MAG: helix-turn-helix domain-containing protein [Deltaproteobacteria bacterium]|jgi:transcriptional regulator with XRE-family HTH domain|nr:helix-turn-helix domain-containing protein [Deltaproteobacteria bacterium]